MKRSKLLTPVCLALFALVACGSPSTGIAPGAQPTGSDEQLERIDCHVAYNPQRPGRTVDLSVAAAEGRQSDRVRFRQMTMRITYFDDGFESPAFNAIVKSTGEKEAISARLYQFERTGGQESAPPKRPANEFVGGHGFTGLAYEFDPDSSAELQYYCEAF